MKHAVLLLLLGFFVIIPANVDAARRAPPPLRYCGSADPGSAVSVYGAVGCVSGVVVRANERVMRVRLPRGGIRVVRFRLDTTFQSDSALGTFAGVQPDDFVCVTAIHRPAGLIALLVVIGAVRSPCLLHRVRRADVSTSVGSGSSAGTGSGNPTPKPIRKKPPRKHQAKVTP